MRYRFLVTLAAPLVAAGILALATAPASGQAAKAAAPSSQSWTQPKTPWGDPDVQGTWTSDDCIGTPMNRPANLGEKAFYTEEELAKRQEQLAQQKQRDLQETIDPNQRVGTGPPAHWGERARRPC